MEYASANVISLISAYRLKLVTFIKKIQVLKTYELIATFGGSNFRANAISATDHGSVKRIWLVPTETSTRFSNRLLNITVYRKKLFRNYSKI